MKLIDSPFSPFARKARMVLEHKGLAFEAIDGLIKSNHDALRSANRRLEVPALIDGDVTVVNSADIIAYLEHRYPAQPVYPQAPAERVTARAWERTADTLIDAALINISYWHWADRMDTRPQGMLEASQAEMKLVYDRLERDLAGREFVCGELSIADIALFPHLMAARGVGIEFSRHEHRNVAGWLSRMRRVPIAEADIERTRAYVARIKDVGIERTRLFWRGDRIEWLFAHGFHEWFYREVAEGRALWPGPALPPG